MRLKLVSTGALALGVFLLSACNSTSEEFKDARFSQANPQNVEAVQNAIAPFFNGAQIQLADDVFTRSSVLLIDKAGKVDRYGNVINGRDMTRPGQGETGAERFYLKTLNNECFILHDESGERIMLSGLNCVAPTSQL
jgi:hypothetical protein